MARQVGPFPIIGRLDEWSFYKDKHHGLLVRHAGGPTKNQIKKGDSMVNVRSNMSEFGKSSKYGALIRRAFRPLIINCSEYTMSRRLQSLTLSIVKADRSRRWGKRDVEKENLILLQAFELNKHLSYQKLFKTDVDIDVRETGIVATGKCVVPKAIAKNADYYKIISVSAGIDFGKRCFSQDVKESELKACREGREIVFQHDLNTKAHLFYGMVICFFKKNGKTVELIHTDKMKAGFISFVQ